jgi:hypothetical protein
MLYNEEIRQLFESVVVYKTVKFWDERECYGKRCI